MFQLRNSCASLDQTSRTCCIPHFIRLATWLREKPKSIPKYDVDHHKLVLRTLSPSYGGIYSIWCTNFRQAWLMRSQALEPCRTENLWSMAHWACLGQLRLPADEIWRMQCLSRYWILELPGVRAFNINFVVSARRASIGSMMSRPPIRQDAQQLYHPTHVGQVWSLPDQRKSQKEAQIFRITTSEPVQIITKYHKEDSNTKLTINTLPTSDKWIDVQ
jgi:hypothetical protein